MFPRSAKDDKFTKTGRTFRFLSGWRKRLAGTCLLILTPWFFVHADTPEHCAVFCGARDQLLGIGLTPIRQLEGEELFASAAAMRERVMTKEQRLLNQYWLNDTAATRIQGGRIWSRLLRHGLTQWRQQNPAPGEHYNPSLDYDALGTDKGDYQLRLSDDNIRLLIHYSF